MQVSTRSLTSRPASRAFTLIELLTVIAIIGILAAILIPTVGAVRKRALKAQCASNLHQLGMAINLYVNDNKQVLPNGAVPNTRLQWIGSDLGKTLISYGMTWQMFFCKGNEAYTADRGSDDYRNRVTANPPVDRDFAIGYVYLPGTTYQAQDQYGRAVASKYSERRISKINYRLIAADLNRKYNDSFEKGVNHSDTLTPFGGNHLYVDGSVKWIEAEKFLARPAFANVDATDYYFKSED